MFAAAKIKHVINKAGDDSGYEFGIFDNLNFGRFNAMKAKFFELVADEQLSYLEKAIIKDWLNLIATQYRLEHIRSA